MLAAVFFIVIVAFFGLVAIRFMSMGQLGSAEAYRYAQARFAAFAGRELHFLYLDTAGSYGWDGASPASLAVGGCSVERTYGDVNASGDNATKLFRVRGACGSETEQVARVWEAVFNREPD